MRRSASVTRAALVAATLVLAGCATAGPGSPGSYGSSGWPGSAGAGSPGAAGAPGSPAAAASGSRSDQAAVYAAVLRQYLTTSDHSFGDDHRFAVAYVLDRTDPAAADPMGAPGPGGNPIPVADQAAILEAIADVGRVEFITDRTSVIEDVDGCAQVRDGGVLIVLGPPVEGSGHVEVAIHGFIACLGATWFTYVVEQDGSGWRTAGTTGPSAIA